MSEFVSMQFENFVEKYNKGKDTKERTPPLLDMANAMRRCQDNCEQLEALYPDSGLVSQLNKVGGEIQNAVFYENIDHIDPNILVLVKEYNRLLRLLRELVEQTQEIVFEVTINRAFRNMLLAGESFDFSLNQSYIKSKVHTQGKFDLNDVPEVLVEKLGEELVQFQIIGEVDEMEYPITICLYPSLDEDNNEE